VATFCHQLARQQKPRLLVDKELELVYVGDLVDRIVELVEDPQPGVSEPSLRPTYRRSVGRVLAQLRRFEETLSRGETPVLSSRFDRLLFSTLLWYHGPEDLEATPRLHTDSRGTLFEVLRSSQGQVFFSTTGPGVIRGNHYHARKVEKFCVVAGDAVIRLRPVGCSEVREVLVSGERPTVVDVPVYHVHHLENVGDRSLMTLFWASEPFDPRDPDTYHEVV
jgi:UDP-2-acetamido-2,6-beta-L-arabino-hexul-4-ose reductase